MPFCFVSNKSSARPRCRQVMEGLQALQEYSQTESEKNISKKENELVSIGRDASSPARHPRPLRLSVHFGVPFRSFRRCSRPRAFFFPGKTMPLTPNTVQIL